MLSMSLFAQMDAFKPDGPQVGGFGVVTLAFLFMVWLFDKPTRSWSNTQVLTLSSQ